MKLLHLDMSGLPLFKGELSVDFTATQRISKKNIEGLYNIGNKLYLNNAIAMAGINASGKTSLLRVINSVLNMLNANPLNSIKNVGLFGEKTVIDSYFLIEVSKTLIKLHSVIGKKNGQYIFESETLYSKDFSPSLTKSSYLDFSKAKILERDNKEQFLKDDISIIISLLKSSGEFFSSAEMLDNTNFNCLRVPNDIPKEIIDFFDPTIEYIKKEMFGDNSLLVKLKFKGKEELTLSSITDLEHYLSSGTIKGINAFHRAFWVFKNGGYMIIDELENHFNHEIVSKLLDFFLSRKTNPKGATLLFSTHYPEILDHLNRNDCVYITRNKAGITTDNLSTLLKRNDYKKSEIFESNFLGGTAPSYEASNKLRQFIVKNVQENSN